MSEQIIKFEDKPGLVTTGFTMNMNRIANCCRVCLEIECSLIEITSLDHDSVKLNDKLTACVAEVMWVQEGLPSLICSNCIERLRVAYDFRNICLQSDQTFTRYISQVKDENKSNESQEENTDPLKLEDTFPSTQFVTETLPFIKEESPDSPEIHFVSTDDCIENAKYFIETGESRNCTPEPEKCMNYINETQLGKPELEEVTQMIQLDQQQQLIHLQNEPLLQHELQVQRQQSQHMINRTAGEQEWSPTPEDVSLDGAQYNSDGEEICTTPKTMETAKAATYNSLPEKSKKQYNQIYRSFMEWRRVTRTHSFSEDILLAYFTMLSEKYKSTSLWKTYSMLRSTLIIHHDVNIENFSRLRAFLKRKGEGYNPKKAKIFSADEINKFITEAPDDTYLATKVALIIGIMGACRNNELYCMKIEDVQDVGSALLITIPTTNTKTIKRFSVVGKLYEICKKYYTLRPASVTTPSFFVNYQHGKYTNQKIGINKISLMAKQIASYLKLSNAELYTGHSFRRSSATLLVDAHGDIIDLKRPGGWKSKIGS